MERLIATANRLILVVERELAGWKTTVRSALNPHCSYVSSCTYRSLDEAKAAAVRIAQVVWGEPLNSVELMWRIPAASAPATASGAKAASCA